VFDTLHTCGNGSLDGCWRERVHCNVSAPILSRLNGRPQLRLCKGRRIDRTEWRGNPTTGRQLDLGGTLHKLLADANANLVGTVGHHAGANLLHAAEHAADGPRQFRQLAEIPVSARHRNHCSRGINPRPRDQTLVAFSPNTGPPTSRTVVKPRISVSVASTPATILLYPTSPTIAWAGFARISIACQCMSIRPGISVRPPPSIIAVVAL